MSVADSVVIGRDILDRLPDELNVKGLGGTVFVVTDTSVGRRYLPSVLAILEESGRRVESEQIVPGERSKSLNQAGRLYEWLHGLGAERGDTLLALGGGVTGDLTGFVAATYLRGMKWAQVATTLLAQVDSSIGGKVAIDLPGGKNLVGAFHNASLSFLDTAMLDSLPLKHLVSGWAEVVKMAIMFDAEFFEILEASLEDPRHPDLLSMAVERSVFLKARIVDQDPRDTGVRALLNYGHTIGHAIEASTDFSKYLHGEAVAVGIAGAAALARKMEILDAADEQRQIELLRQLGLPVTFAEKGPDAVESAMRHDKKVKDGRPQWVLSEAIGKGSFGHLAPPDLEREVIEQLHQD